MILFYYFGQILWIVGAIIWLTGYHDFKWRKELLDETQKHYLEAVEQFQVEMYIKERKIEELKNYIKQQRN